MHNPIAKLIQRKKVVADIDSLQVTLDRVRSEEPKNENLQHNLDRLQTILDDRRAESSVKAAARRRKW